MEANPLEEATGLLPDWLIEEALEQKHVGITPYLKGNLGPCSLDLTLGPEFLVPRPLRSGRARNDDGVTDPSTLIVDPANPGTEPMWYPQMAPTSLTIRPGEFILASTRERVTLGRQYAARVEGKSSWGRLGLQIHVTAGWIDPGFDGTITLELVNLSPWLLRIRPGMKVGQLCLFRLSYPAKHPYGGPGLVSHYQGQTGPVPSRVFQGFTCDDSRTSGRSVL